ncbi:MAG: peptide ABC transporter substrate-binding protein, partial [Acidobacteria bacterium]|nr:peptide ABC transporter substrate-binding protein [Acidobacteriota bacterium]
CTQIQTPASEPYLSATAPPDKQELRWSNGKLPKSFDPARAAASPESDIVCTLYEGLTEIDPSTLNAMPAAAEKWGVSADSKVWTFHLRKDAKWSNGKRVTAADFVASWKRAAAMGSKAAYPELFENIVGFERKVEVERRTAPEPEKERQKGPSSGGLSSGGDTTSSEPESPAPRAHLIGIQALDDLTLQITLVKPDNDFPKLVSDPMFRPIAGDGANFETAPIDTSIVTNGPFTVAETTQNGVTVQRSETYWNKAAVKLERIRFVPTETAEAALEAYKNGDLDAITNSDFEPLALKLLAPYGDFRQTTHSALNLYEFNTRVAAFGDRRVREALAVSIDRQRIVDSEFQGTADAADDFLPISRVGDGSLDYDAAYARDLLTRAGYPNGENFPTVRLVINRNDLQQRVARLVARMWKQNLNVETQIIVKEPAEIDAARAAGDYDIIRRGVVLPTSDEVATLALIFRPAEPATQSNATIPPPDASAQLGVRPAEQPHGPSAIEKPVEPATQPAPWNSVTSAADALYELYSIPLYSPNSYSLVKPYVHGLTLTGLNSVSVTHISIDNNWSPPKASQP